jgi:hypothetical protein
MVVATLFESDVVLDADRRPSGHFVSPKARDPSPTALGRTRPGPSDRAGRRSMVAGLMEVTRAVSSSVTSITPSLGKRGTRTGSIGASRFPAGVRAPPTQLEGRDHPRGVDRGARRPLLDPPVAARIPLPGPGVITMPAGQIDQLVQDGRLLLACPTSVPGSQFVGHGTTLIHRKLHGSGVIVAAPQAEIFR